MRRTHIQDFERIEDADDLKEVVNDKRSGKRASKKKGTRRDRHYEKNLMKHFTVNYVQEEDN